MRRRRRCWTVGLRRVHSWEVLELGWLTFRTRAEAERWILGRRGCHPGTEWVVLPPR